ncbi:hypothetical protein IKG33_00325 [Candidatus Saccharibacteria bacterium]|nr:hypothetical protein [Candidatus Saccharibacteria bacterium]
MRKTQKKVFGLVGLALVIATTVFAALLPNPSSSAVSTVTDTVVVRVVGDVPDVNITVPKSGAVFVDPNRVISFDYEHVKYATMKVKYVDKDGVSHEYTELDRLIVGEEVGGKAYNLDLTGPKYGYGEYTITVIGENDGGVSDEDKITFSLYPVVAKVTNDEENEKIYLDLDYKPYDPESSDSGDVETLIVNIYDENGNLVGGSPITVTAPEKRIAIDYSDEIASGKYKIEVTAYGGDGEEPLYKPVIKTVDYDIDKNALPVPDTGGLFKNLNISQADYLITGLLIFGMVGIGGLVFINRRNNRRSSRRRK